MGVGIWIVIEIEIEIEIVIEIENEIEIEMQIQNEIEIASRTLRKNSSLVIAALFLQRLSRARKAEPRKNGPEKRN